MICAPSLLSADFVNLHEAIDMLNASSAQWIHCDVMDGVFVPNISFGFPVIKAVSKYTSKPLDVHLMIVDPGRYTGAVRDCGATVMNVHYEACIHLNRVVRDIRDKGMQAAVTLNPGTPVEMLRDILPEVDMVLLMSVNPGFGGQSFINGIIGKIQRLKALIAETGSSALIEVDGGINVTTGAMCAVAGADALVAGSYVFGADDPFKAIDSLVNL